MRGSAVSRMFGAVGFAGILCSTLSCLCCAIAVLLVASPSYPATLYVPSADYPTIQSAIDAARTSVDNVQVAAGTYYENLLWERKLIALTGAGAGVTIVDAGGSGHCLKLIDVPGGAHVEGFTLTGGSEGGLCLLGSSAKVTDTVISGNFASYYGGGIYISGGASVTLTNNTISDNSAGDDGGGIYITYGASVTLTGNDIDHNVAPASGAEGGGLYIGGSSTVQLSGNRITNNSAGMIGVDGRFNGDGGGVFLRSDSSATLTANTISGNSTGILGGGVYIRGGSAMLTGNTITGNSAYYGGGVAVWSYSATLEDNTVAGNSARRYGGGVYVHYRSPSLIGNTISGNSAPEGGGVYLYESSATLSNNVITLNTATSYGGGLRLDSSSDELTGNTIGQNSAERGGGVALYSAPATLTDNELTGNSATLYGAGIYIRYESPTLTGNVISQNSSAGKGGGVYSSGASPSLTGNTISGNTAESYGGGLCMGGGAGTVTDNVISGNSSSDDGGGVSLGASSATLTGNDITGNSAADRGGGVRISGSSAFLINNVISDNTASTYGGGLHIRNDSSPTLTNNTVASNSPGGLYHSNYNPANPVVTNCILWASSDYDLGGQPVTITYSDIGVGFVADTGNVSTDPIFVGGGDYHLQIGSGCINAGDNSAPGLPATDRDGKPRIVGAAVDMGAYEHQRPANHRPVAVDDSYSVDEGEILTVALPGVLGNDSDPDLDPLMAVLQSTPSYGTLIFSLDGSFTYEPVSWFTGSDSFTYLANDGILDSNVATVTISVEPVNDPPVAVDDFYAVDEDDTLSVAAPGVLGNDSDLEGDALSAVLVSAPADGTLTLDPDGSFVYTPNADYNGPDSFTYKASDGVSQSNIATVTMTVTPVNDPPVAVDDAYSTKEDHAFWTPAPGVLGNDIDVDGDRLTAILVAAPSHGVVVPDSNGSFVYTPNADYNGTDSFTYKASDGVSQSNIATVTMTVTPVNDPPVAVGDSYSVSQGTTLSEPAPGVLGNDSDVDGDALTAVLVTPPGNGTVTLDPDGSFVYTPNAGFIGTDTFAYVANDGVFKSSVAPVTIMVNPSGDTTPPEIRRLKARPGSLSPPDQRMVEVTLSCKVTDDTDPSPTWRVFSVSSSDPETGLFPDDLSPDWQIMDDDTVLLRAECRPKGRGRTYTITVEAVDASGNRSTAAKHVRVAKAKGGKR